VATRNFMNKSDYYNQCELRKPTENGYQRDVSWIPSKFAIEGNVVKIKQEDGSWDDGWTVFAVHSKMKGEYVLGHERDYKRNRKASDI